MKQTWRWFGPDDPVSLKEIRMAGAEGIISSLHHIPNGSIWSREEIRQRIIEIAAENYTWDVVESLPVHEAIKTAAPERDAYIQNYIQSLKNLAAEGILHVVYNFMALTDWTRTDLAYSDSDGAKTIRFDRIDLAAFDLFILERPRAHEDYPEAVRENANFRYEAMPETKKEALTKIILMGLPGTVADLSLHEFRKKLEVYHVLGKEGLRENLRYFLEQVLPFAEQLGMTLSIHADDPPFGIFGLPRIVSDQNDLDFIINKIPSPANALCFCTGTLGAGPQNNVTELLRTFAPHISFAHLRNVKMEADQSFYESKLFEGSLDMVEIARLLVKEQNRRGKNHPIPYRPDHGQSILYDNRIATYPGYPLIGRLKSLAELRGLFMGLK